MTVQDAQVWGQNVATVALVLVVAWGQVKSQRAKTRIDTLTEAVADIAILETSLANERSKVTALETEVKRLNCEVEYLKDKQLPKAVLEMLVMFSEGLRRDLRVANYEGYEAVKKVVGEAMKTANNGK